MPLLPSRRPPLPGHLAIALPRPDGAGWPDLAQVGRPTFDSSTYHELAVRHAYDLEAHAVADALVVDLLPHVRLAVSPADEPFLRKVLLTAARVGAGVAVVERTLPAPPPGQVAREVAGALWQARRALPAMPADTSLVAGWALLAGFHLGRGGPQVVADLRAALR